MQKQDTDSVSIICMWDNKKEDCEAGREGGIGGGGGTHQIQFVKKRKIYKLPSSASHKWN